MANMFGVIVAGRLVQTDCLPIGDTRFVFNIPEADNINHVVVFMTGATPFPENMGGAVHFSWPGSDGSSWQLLGHITNQKPSAIFKITKLKPDGGSAQPFGMSFQQQASHVAQIGVSVEPLDQLAQQTPDQSAAISDTNTFVEFSTKMCENLFNYVASFTQTQSQMTPMPTETFVPLSTLQRWYENFQRRLQQNPLFWKS
ncbi:unnamed protein product [Owenia fusiformis]|uniref:Uncharacterized protein n=1 Tax=Owenia fusiformis TaxID=6347 RepID=A0A8J1TZ53_OWEFU|nr:unnamed protein product [Owenia fusiformis]